MEYKYKFLLSECPHCGEPLNKAQTNLVKVNSQGTPLGSCPKCGKAIPLQGDVIIEV